MVKKNNDVFARNHGDTLSIYFLRNCEIKYPLEGI